MNTNNPRGFVDYILLDQKVCQLAKAIESNLLVYINPQNVDEQKKKFFAELKKGNIYNPFFVYPSRNPLYSYFSITPTFEIHKNELKLLLDGIPGDALGLIFEKKILDLFERIELMKSVGTPNFSNNSNEYYGRVDSKTLKYAKELISKKNLPKENKISFSTAKERIEAFLKKKKLSYKISLRESTGSKYSVNIRTKEILINKNTVLTEESVGRLIAHEIKGHIYRYENGCKQPYSLFARGLSKETIETEEGIAVVIENMEKVNVDNQLKNYAGRVIAIDIASRKNFFDTFEELTTFFSDDDAFTLALRAKRGVYKQSLPGAFTKDILYLKGYLVVQDFLKEKKIDELYMGRYSVYDVPLVKDVDGLKKPFFLP